MTQQPRIIQFIYKAPVVILWLAGAQYIFHMVSNYREDTTNITNAGFAIMATLAALSFSFARVIESEELKDRVMFAGERFLHGAILTVVATILKYFIFAMLKNPFFSNSVKLEVVLSFTIGMLVSLMFFYGFMYAHTGLRVLNDLLLLRFTRHKDWDNLW